MHKVFNLNPIGRAKFANGIGFILFAFVISWILKFLFTFTLMRSFWAIGAIIFLLAIVWLVVLCIKRLKDLNKSPWWSILLFVPITLPILLVYLLFAKGVSQMNPNDTTTIDTEKPKMSRPRLVFNVIAGLLILSGILYAKHELFPGKSNIKDDPLVGTKVTLGLPLVYAEGARVSGESGIVTQIGRRLLCPSDTMYAAYFAPHFYSDGLPHLKYVSMNTEFTVEKVYGDGKTYPYAGDAEWEQLLIDTGKTVILRDSNGVESTASAYSIKTPGKFCLNGDSAEIPDDIRNVFKSIEQNGTARIEILLSEPFPENAAAKKSDESTRSNFIQALPTQYKFSNVKPIERTVKEYGFDYPRFGVQMDVDANSFAYLLTQKPGLHIESINSI